MSIATTFTDIANLALKSLGAASIENIDANNTHAKAINGVIDEVTRQVQTEIHWPELLMAQELVELPDTYIENTQIKSYQLPQDFLQAVELVSACDWELFNNEFLTVDTSPQLIYKIYNPDVSKWSAELVECVYKKLAMEIAIAVTQDFNIFQVAIQKWEVARDRRFAQMKNRSRRGKSVERRFSYLNVRAYRHNRYAGEKPFSTSES